MAWTSPGMTGREGQITKTPALVDRLGHAFRRRRLRLLGRCIGRTRSGRSGLRPIRIRGGADAAIGEFDGEMRAWSNRGGGMHRVPLRIAHQGKAAREHAAVGQRRQQLAAMAHARVETLQGGQKRAAGALGQPLRALAVARDGVALRLGVGGFEAFSLTSSPAKRSRRLRSRARAESRMRSPDTVRR